MLKNIVRNVLSNVISGVISGEGTLGLSKAIGVTDHTLLVAGDSTGDNTTEWVYLFAEYIVANFPEYTVTYRLFNASSDIYNNPIAVGGSGPRTFDIYNASIAGTRPDYLAGDRFPAAIESLSSVDTFILNHGHNVQNAYGGPSQEKRPSLLVEFVSSVMRVWPDAGYSIIGQNPNRDDDDMDNVIDSALLAKDYINTNYIDVHKLFIDEGKNPSLYADNVHPNAAGQQLFLNAVTGSLVGRAARVAPPETRPWNQLATNLIFNGDFSAFAGATPDGWTQLNCTTVQDAVNFESPNGYSVAMSPTAGGSNNAIEQFISTISKQAIIDGGGWATLLVRVYIPSGTATNSTAKVALTNTAFPSNNYTDSSNPRDGFAWRMTTVQQTDLSPLKVKIFGDSGTGGGLCSIDRAILVAGFVPLDSFSSDPWIDGESWVDGEPWID